MSFGDLSYRTDSGTGKDTEMGRLIKMTTKRNLKTADKVLDEEQLDQVNGGFLLVAGVTAVAVAVFETARKTRMAVYTETHFPCFEDIKNRIYCDKDKPIGIRMNH